MNITIIVMLPVRNANEKIRDMSGVKDDDDDDDCLLFVSVVWTVICSISLNIFFHFGSITSSLSTALTWVSVHMQTVRESKACTAIFRVLHNIMCLQAFNKK